ncbi:MAG TPA: hypothetical protein VK642_11910 [Burkholderiales bacterium]|nr:hypothetical protein [Burkholderiales bacterium]
MTEETTRYTKSAVGIARSYFVALGLLVLCGDDVFLYFGFPDYVLLACGVITAGIACFIFGLLCKPNHVADAARDSLDV